MFACCQFFGTWILSVLLSLVFLSIDSCLLYLVPYLSSMRWLLFLSKLAFICNLLFIPAFILQIRNFIPDQNFSSYIIIIGFVFSILFNPMTNLCYIVTYFINKKLLATIPGWLIVVNILFLFLQVVYLLLMNVDKY